MSKVLVVDDEARYRDHICRALSRDGHDVCSAASGQDAISIGSHFRPEVLIADWMLKDRLHGLHVSEALRAMMPELETILITGFPSPDLRADARSFRVSEFLEKPFEMARLRDAVRTIRAGTPPPLERSPVAVFDVDGNGAIRFPNERARQLFAQADAERPARDEPGHHRTDSDWTGPSLARLGLDAAQMDTLTQQWIAISPPSGSGPRWHLRARRHVDGQGWLVIVVPDDQQQHKDHPVVHMLLDLKPAALLPWPFEGRTLIVDDDHWVRHVVAEQIEYGGGICHTAESAEIALQTCQRDSGITVVVVDYDLPGENVSALIDQVRGLFPEARIVGTSGTDRSTEFAGEGVASFLMKPWTVADLTNLLLGRIGNCVSCGLALPLRRPRPGERPTSWECAGCGGRYSAVLDDGFPEHVTRHARAVCETQS